MAFQRVKLWHTSCLSPVRQHSNQWDTGKHRCHSWTWSHHNKTDRPGRPHLKGEKTFIAVLLRPHLDVRPIPNSCSIIQKHFLTVTSLAGWVTLVTYLRLAVLVETWRAASLALAPVPQEDVVISTAQTVCMSTTPAVLTRGVTLLTDHGGGIAKVTKGRGGGGNKFKMWCLLRRGDFVHLSPTCPACFRCLPAPTQLIE